ncbi:MAG TPA: L-threonylcarbamoyladenylate synthase [Terriglobales bacterium]|nr:L-threonylcarbamoyladenylate synthase [Terriglobales bacterium]
MPDCSNSAAHPEAQLDAAVAAIRAGGVVVYPTETLYGLGVDATSAAALARLIRVKGREPGKPISVLISDEAMVNQLATEIPPVAQRLMQRFWPGALTLLLPARPEISPELTGGSGRIGMRLSSCAAATELVRRAGRPITTTSANPAGAAPAAALAEARAYFGERVDVYVDGGILPGEPASTVVLCDDNQVRVLRAGAIASADLIEN